MNQLLKQKSFIDGIKGRQELYKLLASHEYNIKDTEMFLESINKITSASSSKAAKKFMHTEMQTEMAWGQAISFS